MSSYNDIMGQYYDIVGRGGEFNGAFNQPGYPMPNWGPVPGYGPNVGPMGLAFGAEPTPEAPGAIVATPNGPMPAGSMPMPGSYPGQGYPGPGFPGPGWGWPYPFPPGVVPNGNFLASLLAAKESLLVQPRPCGVARREICGFDRICVGPCETVSLETSPQVLFKPYRLVIPSSIAFQFLIHQIRFGKWNLLANGGSVPAAAFIETAEDTDFNGDTVQPSGNITLVIQNVSGAEVPFSAAIWGKAIE